LNQKGKLKIDPTFIKNILLIRLRRIGDIVLTTPAISALREKFPQAHLTYLVEKPYLELVEGNPSLNEILVVPANQSRRDFIRWLWRQRKKTYDILIDFHGGPRASWTTFLAKAKIKIGYKIKYKSFIYDLAIPRGRQNGYFHSVESHLNLVRVLGANPSTLPPLYLPPAKNEEKEKVNNLLKENNLQGCKPVVIHISAGNQFRNWGEKNILTLCQLLSRHPKLKIILIGSEEDKKAEKALLSKGPPGVVSMVGKLNLRELRELISFSSLFVGPDSGPMHIAASTQTPLVVYFGPTLPANFAPWQAKALLLEKKFDCRPCPQRKCIYGDFRCLRSITPQEVYKACLHLIGLEEE